MKLETNIDNIKDSLEAHVEDQKMDVQDRKTDYNHIMDKLDSMHNSFAGKWVEKVIVGIIVTGAGIIITILV